MFPIATGPALPHSGYMESFFGISAIAQILGWIGIPILAAAALLAALVLTGGAGRLIDLVEDWPIRRPGTVAVAEGKETSRW